MPRYSPAVFVVHSLAQAVAALTAAADCGRPVRLLSGGYLAWPAFQALCRLAGEAVPRAEAVAVFDPAGRAGFAAEALAQGAALVIFPRRHPQRAVLEDLARRCGAALLTTPGRCLDLAGADDPLRAALHWLAPARRAGLAGVLGDGRGR